MPEEKSPLTEAKIQNIGTEPTELLFSKRMDLKDDNLYSRNTLLPKLSLHSVLPQSTVPVASSSPADPTFILSDADTKPLKISTSSLSSSPPSTLYEIKEEIARGGMGIIFKGYQVVLKREVAIKSIAPQLVTSTQRESFIEESQITAFLDHPNIVPVYDLGENDRGETILVMKLIRGKSWRELMQHEPPEKHLEKHLEILLQTCNAMAFAHSRNIIHNDLKPENIMVGEFGEVFVMDWGLATSIEENPERGPFRNHKDHILSPCGTPVYMPPELAEGRGDKIGRWTDVYLLGGILYHLLSGHPPHHGDSLASILYFALSKIPDDLSPSIPKELQQICFKALAKETSARYPTVLQFKEALQQFLKHRESLIIMEEASRLLESCKTAKHAPLSEKKGEKEILRNTLYDRYAEAIAGFRQSLKLWTDNKTAQTGELEAHLEYAKTALQHNDFGLAETQLRQIPQESADYRKIKKIMEQAKEAELCQTLTQRLSIILFLACCILLLETTFGLVYWLSGGTELFGFHYGRLQIISSLSFLIVSLGLYQLLSRVEYTASRLFQWSMFYQISGSFYMTLICLSSLEEESAQLGSIYMTGVWILQFPILLSYTPKFSFAAGFLSASSIFLVFALLPIFEFQTPQAPLIYLLIAGQYAFAIVAGVISWKKQQICFISNRHLHFD